MKLQEYVIFSRKQENLLTNYEKNDWKCQELEIEAKTSCADVSRNNKAAESIIPEVTNIMIKENQFISEILSENEIKF